MIRLNQIHHIDDGSIHLDLKEYAVFTDSFIHEHYKYLRDPNTQEVFKILDFRYHKQYEWDDPSLIQYGAAIHREVKRSAVKTDKPLDPDVLYELITDPNFNPDN